MSRHDFVAPFPGARGLPCALCGRMRRPHLVPVDPGRRLTHNELLDAIGRCDGRCGAHLARPFGHNELVTLHGRCDGSCGGHGR
jgi:hypothetical protein